MSIHNIPDQYKKKNTRNYPKYNNVCNFGFFISLGLKIRRSSNCRGKRPISVRVLEVLLYTVCKFNFFICGALIVSLGPVVQN